MSHLPVVIVLAAGRGERFAASGGAVHKLQALLAGRRVIDHVLRAVKASGLPYHVVEADASRPGMGDSIAAGVKARPDANGWLILPADLPLIRGDTLLAIAHAPPSAVTVPMFEGQRGHPVRFAALLGPKLLNLQGNMGAAQVIRAQAAINSVAYVEVDDCGVVTDVDTLGDLLRAETLLAQR
ncbi:MAG: NTP transferase domain-containing protein [Polaromonas sp.]|nr:NTP transferase domain-containing protein [Polaromonas sp.]